MVLDLFSKYRWIVPLKTKTGSESLELSEAFLKRITPKSYGLTKEKSITIKMLKMN